jgi:hypothetical protein
VNRLDRLRAFIPEPSMRTIWQPAVRTLTAFMVVTTFLLFAVAAVEDSQRKTEIAQAAQDTAATERRDAAIERARLFAAISELRTEAKADAARDAALIAWLQSRGIRVPVGLIAGTVDTDGDGDDDSDQIDRDAQQREQAATRPKAPSPQSGNGGNSGRGNGGGGGSDNGADKSDRGNGHGSGHGSDKDGRGNSDGRDKGNRGGNGKGRGRG